MWTQKFALCHTLNGSPITIFSYTGLNSKTKYRLIKNHVLGNLRIHEYLSLFIHPSIHPSVIYLPTYLPTYNLSIYLFVCLSVYPSVCLSLRLFIHPSIHPSIRPSIHLSNHPSVCLSVYFYHLCLCAYRYINAITFSNPNSHFLAIPFPTFISFVDAALPTHITPLPFFRLVENFHPSTSLSHILVLYAYLNVSLYHFL
jgi:hypothetical protein